MSDQNHDFDPPQQPQPHDEEQGACFPWDADPPPEDPDATRQRHDGFTEARKNLFLRALVKTGCVQDACRRTGIAPRTVYRHQQSDPRFLEHSLVALRMSATPLELTAWQRAVDGVEERFVAGGKVMTRIRHSESLMRLLLKGTNPRKYGPHPGFRRKRLLKHERKQMEREIRAQIEAERHSDNPKGPRQRTFAEAVESILRKVEAIKRHKEPEKLAAGWTRSPDGHWVPPGYAPIPGWSPAGDAGEGGADDGSGGGTPLDSM